MNQDIQGLYEWIEKIQFIFLLLERVNIMQN